MGHLSARDHREPHGFFLAKNVPPAALRMLVNGLNKIVEDQLMQQNAFAPRFSGGVLRLKSVGCYVTAEALQSKWHSQGRRKSWLMRNG